MIIHARNSFERAGRFAKVRALVSKIDEVCSTPVDGTDALHPVRDALRIAKALTNWDELHWRKAALLAGCKLPSEETRRAVVSFYIERGRAA